MSDEAQLTYAFNRLHLIGAKIYIDDFGTGFSSLSYLNKFSIDAIKIDRAFVLALSHDKGQKVFNSILSVADELSLAVVIEGVETKEQLSFVPQDDRVSVQGWYYAKSLDVERLVEYVER